MAGSGAPALSQGVGYGIVLGVGLAFAVFMVSYTHPIARSSSKYPGSPFDLISIHYLHT